jgi:hypothetical protein
MEFGGHGQQLTGLDLRPWTDHPAEKPQADISG